MTRSPVLIAADVVRLAACSLFDGDWYAASYADALADGSEPLVHFCNSGWRNGLWPNPLFDTALYLDFNADVRGAGINPLLHYLDYGESEDRWPCRDFDVAWYRKARQVPAGQNCLEDYLRQRRLGAVSPNAGFNAAWYKAEYELPGGVEPFDDYRQRGAAAGLDPSPEARAIRKSGLFDPAYYARYPRDDPETDPIYHFCRSGWQHHLKPNAAFETEWYLQTNPEVRDFGINPLFHYIRYGELEGRKPSPDFDPVAYRRTHDLPERASSLRHRLALPAPAANAVEAADPDHLLIAASGLFDIDYYLANYPDVRESGIEPLAHFMADGWREGRRPNPYFDPEWYGRTYPDDPALNPLSHYILNGEAAGHRPVVYFDPAWYGAAYQLASGTSPLRHYLANRRGQKHSPTRFFNIDWYMDRHRNEIGPNRDPFAHYLRVGITRDIDPSPGFDAASYRRTYMAGAVSRPRPVAGAEIIERLRREALNPLVHYLLNSTAAGGAGVLITVSA